MTLSCLSFFSLISLLFHGLVIGCCYSWDLWHSFGAGKEGRLSEVRLVNPLRLFFIILLSVIPLVFLLWYFFFIILLSCSNSNFTGFWWFLSCACYISVWHWTSMFLLGIDLQMQELPNVQWMAGNAVYYVQRDWEGALPSEKLYLEKAFTSLYLAIFIYFWIIIWSQLFHLAFALTTGYCIPCDT